MCTVSIIARKQGYALGMNRDEQLTRVCALPPAKNIINGCTVLSPSEPGGGTWIAVNDSGVAFALINWYSITRRVKGQTVSRGQVVTAASGAKTPDLADAALAQLPLKRINPFRLVGIFPASGEIVEWRWDLKRLFTKQHPWKDQQWISSGFDEPVARRIRSRTFREALKQKSAGGLGWLRRLHRSHVPVRGAFSTCMHRNDAITVSYTEIVVAPSRATMRYHRGAPCRALKHSSRQLRLQKATLVASR
jgi:hypothetical protein